MSIESKTTREKLAAQIHYPECWDTAAYPTLDDALWEIVSNAGCSECKNPCIDEDVDLQHSDILEG